MHILLTFPQNTKHCRCNNRPKNRLMELNLINSKRRNERNFSNGLRHNVCRDYR